MECAFRPVITPETVADGLNNIENDLMYLNVKGTKDGPGKKSPDVLPLTCTPILDEEDKPIEGTRLDWIKHSACSESLFWGLGFH